MPVSSICELLFYRWYVSVSNASVKAIIWRLTELGVRMMGNFVMLHSKVCATGSHYLHRTWSSQQMRNMKICYRICHKAIYCYLLRCGLNAGGS